MLDPVGFKKLTTGWTPRIGFCFLCVTNFETGNLGYILQVGRGPTRMYLVLLGVHSLCLRGDVVALVIFFTNIEILHVEKRDIVSDDTM